MPSIKEILFIEAKHISPEALGLTGEALANYNNEIDQRIMIAEIEASIYKTKLGGLYNLAAALLTAHNINLSDLSSKGQSGFVIEEKINEETIKYSQSKNDSDYSATSYGKRYEALIKPFQQTTKRKVFGGFVARGQ